MTLSRPYEWFNVDLYNTNTLTWICYTYNNHMLTLSFWLTAWLFEQTFYRLAILASGDHVLIILCYCDIPQSMNWVINNILPRYSSSFIYILSFKIVSDMGNELSTVCNLNSEITIFYVKLMWWTDGSDLGLFSTEIQNLVRILRCLMKSWCLAVGYCGKI